MNIENTYWNSKGLHQKEVDEMVKANFPIQGSRTYYRFYNDGDFPRGVPGIDRFSSQEEKEIRLEAWMNEKIRKAYTKFTKQNKGE